MVNIPYVICSILSFVPAIVLHEVSHGYAAFKLGDPTAKERGRLTLNPLKHVDWFGTILLPGIMMLAGGPVFGYAKPVPYNPMYFKDKRKGDLIVGLAGPAANLVMAVVGGLVAWGLYFLLRNSSSSFLLTDFFQYFYFLFIPLFILINLYLMFFNLLPIPPLDGSSIFAFLLPEKYLPVYYKVERYAMPVFLILVFLLPSVLHVDPIGAYLQWTAQGLYGVLYPFA